MAGVRIVGRPGTYSEILTGVKGRNRRPRLYQNDRGEFKRRVGIFSSVNPNNPSLIEALASKPRVIRRPGPQNIGGVDIWPQQQFRKVSSYRLPQSAGLFKSAFGTREQVYDLGARAYRSYQNKKGRTLWNRRFAYGSIPINKVARSGFGKASVYAKGFGLIPRQLWRQIKRNPDEGRRILTERRNRLLGIRRGAIEAAGGYKPWIVTRQAAKVERRRESGVRKERRAQEVAQRRQARAEAMQSQRREKYGRFGYAPNIPFSAARRKGGYIANYIMHNKLFRGMPMEVESQSPFIVPPLPARAFPALPYPPLPPKSSKRKKSFSGEPLSKRNRRGRGYGLGSYFVSPSDFLSRGGRPVVPLGMNPYNLSG